MNYVVWDIETDSAQLDWATMIEIGAILLDENFNNILDKNYIGIPSEQYGFSSKKQIRFRKPKFDEGSIEFSKNSILNIKLQ